jgi:hypothetical protein
VLILSDEIWVLPNPETAAALEDGALADRAGANAPAARGEDEAAGDVSDWTASSASEAAPKAGNIVKRSNTRRQSGLLLEEQAACHDKNFNEMMVFLIRKSAPPPAIGAACGRNFHYPPPALPAPLPTC